MKVQEMEVLKTMVHKNVVKLHEIIDDPLKNKLYLVMDYLSGGTLAEKLKDSNNGLPEEEVRKYIRELVAAIHYCHEVKQLAHRDIKPENMMINKDEMLVLCDFGVSQFFKVQQDKLDVIDGQMGTVRFMSPECFQRKQGVPLSGKGVYIWAAGVTLF